MASEVDVANDALTFLGASRITSLTQDQTEAKVMNQLYQRSVDAVLRAYPWKCAKAQQSLPRSATAPVYGWDYSYQLPTAPICLRVLDVENADRDDKWDRYGDFLYTDLDTCKITFISRIDAASFDPLLRDAVAARLAADSAYALIGSNGMMQQMYELYMLRGDDAREASQIEGSSPVFVSQKFEQVRK